MRDITSLLVCVLLSICIYGISIMYYFHIHFSWQGVQEACHIGVQILQNLGNPTLKLKSYMALIFASLPLIVWVIFSLMGNAKPKGNYGNARFANEKEIQAMGLNYESGMIFGCLNKGRDKKLFIRSNQPLSTLIVAPPGTGKTASIAIPNLLSLPQSCVVLDIKGELYQKTAGYRHKNSTIKCCFSPLLTMKTQCFLIPLITKSLRK